MSVCVSVCLWYVCVRAHTVEPLFPLPQSMTQWLHNKKDEDFDPNSTQKLCTLQSGSIITYNMYTTLHIFLQVLYRTLCREPVYPVPQDIPVLTHVMGL